MATEIWFKIGSGNGLLPDGTKPLPEPMLTYHQWSPVNLILRNFTRDASTINHQSLFENYISENSFKFTRGHWVKVNLWKQLLQMWWISYLHTLSNDVSFPTFHTWLGIKDRKQTECFLWHIQLDNAAHAARIDNAQTFTVKSLIKGAPNPKS